jgi:hypothetical protein
VRGKIIERPLWNPTCRTTEDAGVQYTVLVLETAHGKLYRSRIAISPTRSSLQDGTEAEIATVLVLQFHDEIGTVAYITCGRL